MATPLLKCYLCQTPLEPFLKKNGYRLYRCPSCGLKTTDLGENYDSFVKKFYTKGYYTGDPRYAAYASYASDKWHILQNMKKFLVKVRQYKKSGKLLDVGCALGYFVELANKSGFDAYGFDASEFAAKKAQARLNGRIKHGLIQTVNYPQKSFDVITMFDVVEHLGNPIRDLRKLMTFLKDDGILIVATGNTQSLAARLLKRRWTFYIPPQHLFFFTKKTFTSLLAVGGLVPIEWFGVNKWLSLRYVLHLARSTGESVLADHLFVLIQRLKLGWLPLFLPLRDNMVVVAKKDIGRPS